MKAVGTVGTLFALFYMAGYHVFAKVISNFIYQYINVKIRGNNIYASSLIKSHQIVNVFHLNDSSVRNCP